jgi:hypothetical protein
MKISQVITGLARAFASVLPFCISPLRLELIDKLEEMNREGASLQNEIRRAGDYITRLKIEIKHLKELRNALLLESNKTIPYFYLDPNAPKLLFDATYRALAKEYHPDKGPKHEEVMKQINVTKDKIYKERGW